MHVPLSPEECSTTFVPYCSKTKFCYFRPILPAVYVHYLHFKIFCLSPISLSPAWLPLFLFWTLPPSCPSNLYPKKLQRLFPAPGQWEHHFTSWANVLRPSFPSGSVHINYIYILSVAECLSFPCSRVPFNFHSICLSFLYLHSIYSRVPFISIDYSALSWKAKERLILTGRNFPGQTHFLVPTSNHEVQTLLSTILCEKHWC